MSPMAKGPTPTADEPLLNRRPKSFNLMPSMPAGGTAFTSPATLSCVAVVSSAWLIT